MFSCNLLVCKLKLCDGIIMSFILYKINIAWSKYCSYLDIEDITNVMIHSVLYTFQGLLPPSLYCSCLPRVAVKKGKNDFEKILMPESNIMPCHGTLRRKAGATFRNGRCVCRNRFTGSYSVGLLPTEYPTVECRMDTSFSVLNWKICFGFMVI